MKLREGKVPIYPNNRVNTETIVALFHKVNQ